MKCISIVFFRLIFSLLFYPSFAQSQNSFFVKKTDIKGLPTGSFFSTIHQDSDGFLWIGTISGLFKYDGSRVTRFLRDPADSNSLTHNYANSIAHDKQGDIWIGTYGGFMNKYDRLLGKVKRIEPGIKSQFRVTVMKVKPALAQTTLMVATAECIYNIHQQGTISDSIIVVKNAGRISDFLEYEIGKFLVATTAGLFIVNWNTREIQELFLPGDGKHFNCIETDRAGSVWIGSDRGIYCIRLDGLKFAGNTVYDWSKLSMSANVRSIRRDNAGRMWIGTKEGLFVEENRRLQKITGFDTTIAPLNINDVFVDKKQTVWVATGDNGLYQVYQPDILFRHIAGMQEHSKKTTIQSINEESPNKWLIGTINGLFRYHLDSRKFEKIDITNTRVDLKIAYQLHDKRNGWWVGTNASGLFYKSAGANQFIQFKHDPANEYSLPSDFVTSLEEDRYGNIWIGTYNGGKKTNSLSFYDPGSGRIQRIKGDIKNPFAFNSSNISQLAVDKDQYLWIGSWDDGLYRYQLKEPLPSPNTFVNYSETSVGRHKISNDVVSCVRPGKNGLIWFGTVSGGLNVLDTKLDSICWYTLKDGIASNLVYRIEEDDQGAIWVSTDNGISRFDPLTKTFLNYTTSSGLVANNFAFLTSAKCLDGTILLGTNDGQVVYFNPNAYKNYAYTQPVVITDIRVFNKSIAPGVNSLLTKAPHLTDTLLLAHDHSVISFELANLDFLNPDTYTYAYQLQGFDKSWTYMSDRNAITYTNLDPGKYTLLIKNANHHGTWNETATRLVLIIKPPFHQTWWFITLVLLAITGLIYALFRYRLQQKLRVFQVRNRLHRDLHDDVGATLSTVKAYSEILKDNPNNPVIAELIKDNSTEMLDRLEIIAWATNPEHDLFRSLQSRMLNFARPLCHAKNMECHLEVKGIPEELLIPGEIRQNIFLVFKEAINNIIKYAAASTCKTELVIRNKHFIMEIKDNGKGFDGNIKGSGNGWKNMKKRTEEINGNLVIASTPGNGTIITMQVPYPFKIPSSWEKKPPG